MPEESDILKATGSQDFSGGVDSSRTTTVASEINPHGLKPNMLAWMNNATVRGSGISQRPTWQPITKIVDAGIYTSKCMCIPENQVPYLMLAISGRVYRVRVDTDNSVEDITGAAGNVNPITDYGYMEQGNEFVVIQAGDFTTLPLFWDAINETMTRSLGLPGKQLPAAGPMHYYGNRMWYAIGTVYTAGDISGGPSGTNAGRTNSILMVTENPLAIGGDGFRVPTTAGNIRALKSTAVMDKALGQGELFSFTRQSIFALSVPITRNDWIGATNNNQPLQRVAQKNFGSYNDRSIVNVNGDLFYQSTDGIRSLFQAVRYFQQWGNTPISNNVIRAEQFNNRALMRFSWGVNFDNRLLQSCLPKSVPAGVASQAILPLDFDLISTLDEKLPPAWEGTWEGLDILDAVTGNFGGRERCFGIISNQTDGSIWLWELTNDLRFENGDNRVTWAFETPAWTWDDSFKLKKFDGIEVWYDKLFGTVDFVAEYRVDGYPCWFYLHAWQECAARDCGEDIDSVLCPAYPREPFCEQYNATKRTPIPIPNCLGLTSNSQSILKKTGRPSNLGYQFQIRIRITGWCRIRGVIPYCYSRVKPPYAGMNC